MEAEEMTLLEAADRLHMTKNTVKGRIRKAPEGAIRRASDGRIFLTPAGFAWLQQTDSEPRPNSWAYIQNQIKTGNSGKNENNQVVNQSRTEEPVPPVETGRTSGTGETTGITADAFRLLSAQLDAKDRQIADQAQRSQEQLAAKDQQISELAARLQQSQDQLTAITGELKEAHRQLSAAQALHIATVQQQLEGPAQEPQAEQQPIREDGQPLTVDAEGWTRCTSCGKQIRAGELFCKFCGSRQTDQEPDREPERRGFFYRMFHGA